MSLRWQYGRVLVGADCSPILAQFRARRCRFTGRVELWNDYQLHRYGHAWWMPSSLGRKSFAAYPGLNWWRRLKQWYAVLAEESMLQASGKPSLWKMWRAWRTGEVTRAEWRARLRRCRHCPVFDGELRRCRGPQMGWSRKWVHAPQVEDIHGRPITVAEDPGNPNTGFWEKVAPPPPAGCGCYVPFLALTKRPYTGPSGSGCWGRAVYGGDFGWE